MAGQRDATVQVSAADSPRGQGVALAGRIDVRSAADVRLALHAEVDAGLGDLYVDLSGAEIGDATGLGVLVEAHRRARREGRRLVLTGLTPRTSRLLRAARLDRVIPVDVAGSGAEPSPALVS